jgi:hypothetical protein
MYHINILTNINIMQPDTGRIDLFGQSGFTAYLTPNSVVTTDNDVNLVSETLSNGQIIIGNTNNVPSIGNLAGTTNQVIVINGAGSITLGTPQNIDTKADVSFNTVNGRDVGLDGAHIDYLYTTIDIKDVTLSEIKQIQNIGTTNISNPQWQYLGNLDQNLNMSASPTFAGLTLSGLTASTMLGLNSSKGFQSIFAVYDQANGNNSTLLFSGNSLTLHASNSQDISTAGIPSFSGITLTGNMSMGTNAISTVGSITSSGTIQASTINDTSLTASLLCGTDISKNLQSLNLSNTSANGIIRHYHYQERH